MIGQMRDRITFQSPVSNAVGGGGVETTYHDVLTDWCNSKQLNSSRELSEFQTALKNGYQFTIRQRNGFIPDKAMLIVYNGDSYTINSIQPEKENHHRFWRIIAIVKN